MRKHLLAIIALAFVCNISAQETWRFINIPDYHNAEGLSTQDDAERAKRIADQSKGFVKMKSQYGGELITIPGDIMSGHWYRKKFLNRFKSNPMYANFSTEEVVLEASERCYSGMNALLEAGGYHKLLIAVGDHEIGDNPWRKGSEVVRQIENFRTGFAKGFTLDAKGQSLFTEKIGNAEARPIGTIYEHTSNAYQHKNVLFVTIDMFRFDDANKNLGDEGVVTGDITGKHLEWLESVLKEAQTIESIDHIVVQSHLPIIYPVRKYASSGMLVDDRESEKILNLFRKYKVDLYLAGEVHMNTVTKDPKSDLIQFVGRGNNLSNLTTVDVSKQGLNLTCYQENGTVLGNLSIDKSSEKTEIAGDGLLQPIAPDGLQIHWSFDEVLTNEEYAMSVSGNFPKTAKQNPLLKAMEHPVALQNDGGFEYDYVLIAENVKLVEGKLGKAVEISEQSKMFVIPIGPMDAGYERTIACWVKTDKAGRQLIFNSASYWGKGQFFNLSLNEGDLELALRPDIYTHTKEQHINDGNWHHVAVVFPKKNGVLSDVQLYVDGQELMKKEIVKGAAKVNTSQANWMSVATDVPSYKTDVFKTMGMVTYQGFLDDFSIWTRGLTREEIKEIYEEGLKGVSTLALEKN